MAMRVGCASAWKMSALNRRSESTSSVYSILRILNGPGIPRGRRRAVAVSSSLRLSHAGAPQTGCVLIDSAWGSLDTLEIEYDVARALRQLLVRRLSVLAAGVLALVVWLHVLPWSVFIVTVLLATAMLGVAVRNDHEAHERYRATAIQLATLMKVLPQTASQPKAR